MIHSSQEFKTHMTTMTGILEKLRLKKIDNEFKMNEEGFTAGKGKTYQPEELKIIRTYRFEGESDPEDNSAIYLIEATDGLIGYTIDVYGANSDHDGDYDDFLRKIPVAEKEEAQIF